MKLILNDIKYLSLKDIVFYKDRIYYHIKNIRINGLYFKKCIKKVIKNKITHNKMYYISSVYNEMIRNNKKIIHAKLKSMTPLGSPFELKKFIKDKNLKKSNYTNLF